MDRLLFVFSLPGKPDLDLWMPPLASEEDILEVETLFALIVKAQRRVVAGAEPPASQSEE